MTPLSRVIYIDTLFMMAALSFVMDYLLLWATAKVTRVERGGRRLAAGSLLGTVYFVIYVLSASGVLPHYGWLRYWPVVLLTALSMVALAFYPVTRRQLLRVTGFFFLIAVSSGGAGIAAGYALEWGVMGQLFTSIVALLIIAELGWGVVQKSVWQRIYHVPVEIELFEESVRMTGLLDTGNRLKDPLGGSSVIVIEHAAIAHTLPEHLREVLHRMERGDMSEISRLLSSSRLSSRFRVIPFASLGNENGLLVGFRPDKATVHVDGEPLELGDVIVGIAPHALDPDGVYQALLHPDLLRTGIERSATEGSPHRKEGESAHASSIG